MQGYLQQTPRSTQFTLSFTLCLLFTLDYYLKHILQKQNQGKSLPPFKTSKINSQSIAELLYSCFSFYWISFHCTMYPMSSIAKISTTSLLLIQYLVFPLIEITLFHIAVGAVQPLISLWDQKGVQVTVLCLAVGFSPSKFPTFPISEAPTVGEMVGSLVFKIQGKH